MAHNLATLQTNVVSGPPQPMPHLSRFIQTHTEDILREWEQFARELPATSSMDVAALRDHAKAMLTVIARDLETPQTDRQRVERAHGAADAVDEAATTAASQHGLGRAHSGFGVDHMLAEFRALRTSVTRLWRKAHNEAGPAELEELTRFNEAIDQAIAESLARYTREVEATRDRFFAVLGHDLRTPLGVILTSSQLLLDTATLSKDERNLVLGMERSGRRMIELVKDLLDLALTRLGSGIPVSCAEMDLDALVRDVVSEVASAHPGSRIEVESTGPLTGSWDKGRLGQALINLVSNAVEHGSRGTPVRVTARGDGPRMVTVSVSNAGPPIPPEQIGGLFDAMKGGVSVRDRRHLGLGLYIVDKIVEAHGGSIDIRSEDGEGTTFTVSLPRGGC